MAEMKLYELEMLRSRIYHGEQELISTLTPEQKIALLLRIKPEKVLEIIATKQAHIEKCRKRLKQEAKP